MQRKATQQSTALERTIEAIRKARLQTKTADLVIRRAGFKAGKESA